MVLLTKLDRRYKEVVYFGKNLYIGLDEIDIRKKKLDKKVFEKNIAVFLELNGFNILNIIKKKDEIFLDGLTSIFFKPISGIVFLRDSFNEKKAIRNLTFVQEKNYSKYKELYQKYHVKFGNKKYYKLKIGFDVILAMLNIFKYKDLIGDDLFKIIKDLQNYVIKNKINIKREIDNISKTILIKNDYKKEMVNLFESNLNILFLKYDKSDTTRISKLYGFLKYLNENKDLINSKFNDYLKYSNDFKLFSNKRKLSNYYFWESYFSNFIEGTEFEIDEAIEIVNTDKIYDGKESDTYHVRNYFNFIKQKYPKIYGNPDFFINLSVEDFIKFIQIIHKNITSPSNIAGKFKTRPNRVGTYYYVLPENIDDTLSIGHILAMELLKNGEIVLAYMFYHFLISEVHPFADGNGRTVRIFTNLLLLANKHKPIIVSNMYRRIYTKGLACLSKDNDMDCYINKFSQIFNENANFKFDKDIKNDSIMEKQLDKDDDSKNKGLFDILGEL